MNRRDFLFLRAGQPAVLSCEQLYMRYVDACADGTTAHLFEQLARDVRGITLLQLADTEWLAHADLKAQLDPILESFRSSGGRTKLLFRRLQ